MTNEDEFLTLGRLTLAEGDGYLMLVEEAWLWDMAEETDLQTLTG